jgi:hypothetical protein
MAGNFKAYYKEASGVVYANTGRSRVVAIHAESTVAGTFDLQDSNGSQIKFQVAASSGADIYIGELGVQFDGTISVSMPANGAGLTLIVG